MFFIYALFLNFVGLLGKCNVNIPLFLEERISFRKDAPKQPNYEEFPYDEKTTIYFEKAFIYNPFPSITAPLAPEAAAVYIFVLSSALR
jgi:hypothetical protein